jgi:hypothetical protein
MLLAIQGGILVERLRDRGLWCPIRRAYLSSHSLGDFEDSILLVYLRQEKGCQRGIAQKWALAVISVEPGAQSGGRVAGARNGF